jgi:lysozyme
VPTIGIGATSYLDGRAIQLTDPPITREAAIALCRESIQRRYAPMTSALCPGIGSSLRLAALIDFAFNLGTGALKSSTLRKRVNAGRWADVPRELRKWVHSRGKPLRGLVVRREAEVGMIYR